MTLLLDTQVAVWWVIGGARLIRSAKRRIVDRQCAVSVASILEVAVKHRTRKLDLSPATFRDGLLRVGVTILSIGEEHAIGTADVLLDHGDPFDRILVATAMVEGLQLLTADAHLLDAADANASLPIVAV